MALRFEGTSILIVDDSLPIRSLIADILKSFGCKNVYQASDGEVAVKMLDEYTIDIALVDWVMEPMDGIKFTQYVRNDINSPNTFMPIIMISAYTQEHRVLQARDVGITEFLAKPILPNVLYERLRTVVETPRNFIKSEKYFGPDRRRQIKDIPFADRRVIDPITYDITPEDAA